jgi:hypothetical protein
MRFLDYLALVESFPQSMTLRPASDKPYSPPFRYHSVNAPSRALATLVAKPPSPRRAVRFGHGLSLLPGPLRPFTGITNFTKPIIIVTNTKPARALNSFPTFYSSPNSQSPYFFGSYEIHQAAAYNSISVPFSKVINVNVHRHLPMPDLT